MGLNDIMRNTDLKQLKRLVRFCVLMENHEGILGKAPSYIFEKWDACEEENSSILDMFNQYKYDEYMRRWKAILPENADK